MITIFTDNVNWKKCTEMITNTRHFDQIISSGSKQ